MPLGKQIERSLYSDIVECRIFPGQHLSEKDVAARFGVSRQPVREVFIRLAENGLIRILPQRGSYVTRISLPQVSEVAFIRQSIECALVRKLAEQGMTNELCAGFEENLQQQQTAITNGDISDFLVIDDRFHALLADAASYRLSWYTIAGIKPAMDRVRFLSLQSLSSAAELLVQHEKIYSAICMKDPITAASMMHGHLDDITHTVQQIYQRWPDWFSL
ncbi:TPA: FCD domain-containing protein [Citrobacter freundii]|nr:FCD domain-containing protein [Citrobacter freundii]